jgi:ribosomal protein S18 acetylase RimI-like enzyme
MLVNIEPYQPAHRDEILALTLTAWGPVFQKMQPAVQGYVYNNFYPNGWEVRQLDDIAAYLDDESDQVQVATYGDRVIGFIGIRLHPQDHMGEIYVLAVDPDEQRKGVANALMDAAIATLRVAGAKMVMVETGDDPGHSASRAAYKGYGFTRWPIARYFKEL